MQKPNKRKLELKNRLNEITESGIRLDARQLKKDMCSQFSNYREWIREFVVNAYDAMASYVRIWGEVCDDMMVISVQDDGIGMNQSRLKLFFTLYESAKDIDLQKAVGTHGIGKLSIAAIPYQSRFEVLTSTGDECWRAIAGTLDSEQNIIITKEKEKHPRGTTFKIYFKPTCSLADEMNELAKVLKRYVRFLPVKIYINLPSQNSEKNLGTNVLITDNWNSHGETYAQHYKVNSGGKIYEVQLAIENKVHEVYQRWVYITNSYNLLSYDLDDDWMVSHLTIRINGTGFMLPFGRHCISNEEILVPLAQKLRAVILPQFMTQLYDDVICGYINNFQCDYSKIIELTCDLARYSNHTNDPWCKFEFILNVNLGKVSVNDIYDQIKKHRKIYIEDGENNGIDYTYFSELILHHNQPSCVIGLLSELFNEHCVALSKSNLVFESPSVLQKKIGQQEKIFEKHLGLHPELMDNNFELFFSEDKFSQKMNYKVELHMEDNYGSSAYDRLEDAADELMNQEWKVNYLVEKDMVTPAEKQLFLVKEESIILNLHHPDIKKLVSLSKTNPKLAGHWGVSLCLDDSRNVLPHLADEMREDLIMLDGIAKLSISAHGNKSSNTPEFLKFYNQFRRILNDSLNQSKN